jgi:hypothetical protein
MLDSTEPGVPAGTCTALFSLALPSRVDEVAPTPAPTVLAPRAAIVSTTYPRSHAATFREGMHCSVSGKQSMRGLWGCCDG